MVLENGTLFARYAAERELVQRLVAVLPAEGGPDDAKSISRAEAHLRATRPGIPVTVLRAASPAAAAKDVLAALAPLAAMAPGA